MSSKNTMSNKKIGNEIEKEFVKIAYENGYWAHILDTKITGQPFDVIMAKDELAWFLDVKHVADKDYLLHSRIEENQINAFKMLLKRNVMRIGFVIKFENHGWYYLPFYKIDLTKNKTHMDDMLPLPMK